MKPSTAALWRFSRLLLAGLVMVGLLAAPRPVSADYTIAQTDASLTVSFSREGQSFTTGQAGYIHKIDLYTIQPGLTGLMEIHAGNDPNGTLLSASIPYTFASSGWNSVTIDPPVHVDAGTQYTFTTYSINGSLATSSSKVFPGGTMYAVITDGYTPWPVNDLAFRISIVDPVTLTVAKSGAGAGKVTGTPGAIDCGDGAVTCSGVYARFTQVALTAVELPGGAFAGWTGPNGFTSADQRITVALDSSKSYTASFTQVPYTLNLKTAGLGSGSATKSPVQDTYFYNDSVTLTAAPDPGSAFAGWAGPNGFTSADAEITVQVTANATYTATFSPIPYTLTLAASGLGSGSVTKTPEQDTYRYNDSVTLKAQAAPGSIFGGWSGPNGFASADAETTVQVTADATYTAAFHRIYTLTVQPLGDGAGAITSQPAGINCAVGGAASGCSAVFLNGTPVTLTAAAGQNATFAGWDAAGCSGAVPGGAVPGGGETCTVTVNKDMAFTPRFAANADLAIQTRFAFADGLALTITVSNRGPSNASGATVAVALPEAAPSAGGWTWTCEASGGASCASGSGIAIHETVNLPAQGQVIFTARAALANGGRWSASAEVTAPETVFDTDASNNHAEVTPYRQMLPFVRR